MIWTVVKFLSVLFIVLAVVSFLLPRCIETAAKRYDQKLYEKIRAEKRTFRTDFNPSYAREWYELSWARNAAGQSIRPNPVRVIALAEKMIETDRIKYGTRYQKHKHMTSSYYSQIKYLLKSGNIIGAYAFFVRCYKHRELGLEARETIPENMRDPGDLEVFYAPDFLLGRVPYFGQDCKEVALQALEMEWERLAHSEPVEYPIPAALVGSKLYAMTGYGGFRERAKWLGLTRDMEPEQVRRIANHYGFANEEEFYQFIGV